MSDLVRNHLCRIVRDYGRPVCSDARRCEALLRDLCGSCRREINLLIAAQRLGIVEKLLNSTNSVPTPLLIAQSTKSLYEDMGIAEDLAQWAVESWVAALKNIGPVDAPVQNTQNTSNTKSASNIPKIPRPPAHPTTMVNPEDGAVMLWVPEGQFIMGSTDEQISRLLRENPKMKAEWANCEKPQHKVYLDGFWMYKREVTVAQYRRFCSATKRNMPNAPLWGWHEDHPVVNVDWYDARDYAMWAGASLPTEAQWEKAARGTDGREYPWGNEWDATKCKVFSKEYNVTQAVGACRAGASPYGFLDMVGNVWEWCEDLYDEDYYKTSESKNPPGPAHGNDRVVRGGSWYGIDQTNRCATRSHFYADLCYSLLGFRLVCKD